MSSAKFPFWTQTKPVATRLVDTHAELLATRGSKAPVPSYDWGIAYPLGPWVVVQVPGRSKVDVRLRDGGKLLICGVFGAAIDHRHFFNRKFCAGSPFRRPSLRTP